MHYLIDRATLMMNGKKSIVSMLIQEDEIRLIGNAFSQSLVMKMDVSPFIMTPSLVKFIPHIPDLPFPQFKQFFSEQFLLTGCSAFVTTFRIQYEFEFESKLLEKRTQLLNSPIDYMLGVQMPADKVTTSIVKKCKKEKIPLIFIELKKDLPSIPWGWLREAAFPFNPIFIPVFLPPQKPFAEKRTLQKWAKQMKEERISHLAYPLTEKKSLNEDELKLFGLYPKRGVLRPGGEISYNLYLKMDEWDKKNPDIAVYKGLFNTIENQSFFRPGFGQEIMINKTALFV